MQQRAEITEIGFGEDHRLFSLAEAIELFPLIQKITRLSYDELAPVKQQMENMLPTDPRLKSVEKHYEAIVKRWVGKMEKLGVIVKGLWLVNFDTGDGYLCWRYPELRIGHFQGYDDGFAGRRPLAQVIEELNPDWV